MDIHEMMENPWTYVTVFVVCMLLVVVTLVSVRVAGARSRRGGDPHDDRHLG